MKELCDGEMFLVKGSGVKPYEVKNTGGVYSCSCPAWRNQSVAIERRTCKHLRKLRGDAAEQTRIGGDLPQSSAKAKIGEESEGGSGPPVLLAGSWDSMMDLSGWWLSEKLDGVRAYWDGRRFLSRLGNVYHPPSWFTKNLPATPLDGELWVDRKQFQKTVSIVRRQDQSDQWKEVSYLVFDAPAGRGSFEERMDTLRGLLAGIPDRHVRMVEQNLCRGVAHLREELARIVTLGGEGVMARQPGSVYEAGRSATLLKVKQFQDAEAVVIGHEAGSGKHRGRLGSLRVQLPDGTDFSVGTGLSDAERETPPPIGSLITFRYQELSNRGVPRFPSFLRVRSDAVVERASAVAKRALNLVGSSQEPANSNRSVPASKTGFVAQPERSFEIKDHQSAKFWGIRVQVCEVTVRSGRIGGSGQTQSKSFKDEIMAQAHAAKLVTEKTRKGYKETSSA
jgi:DNA ligase-1